MRTLDSAGPMQSPKSRVEPFPKREAEDPRPAAHWPIEPRSFSPRTDRPVRADRRAIIVIPCLNEARTIAQVVTGVLHDAELVEPLVLVADGGSQDDSCAIVRAIAACDRRVRLLANPARLQSAGVNLAIRALAQEGGAWLIRADAHAEYPPNYASTLIAEARRTGAEAVAVAMEARGEGVFQRAAAAAQNSRLGTGGAAHRLHARAGWVDHGHHALIRRAVFTALGGYDDSFGHNEDAEFDLRLRRTGGRIWLTNRVRVAYLPRRTPLALGRQYFNYGRGRARTVLKHRAPLKPRQAAPLGIAPAVLALISAPLAWPLAIPALTWAAVALTYGVVLAARARDPAVLLSGPAAMIMHLAWSAGFWAQLGFSLRNRLRR